MLLYKGRARSIAHAVKERDKQAYWLMAESLVPFVKANDVLIPAPNHEGYAVYTLEIARMIQEKTGCKISDSLAVIPHTPLYSDKSQPLEMFLRGTVEQGSSIYFLDNVIATGKTFLAAKKVVPGLKVLPYAYTKNCLDFIPQQWIGFDEEA